MLKSSGETPCKQWYVLPWSASTASKDLHYQLRNAYQCTGYLACWSSCHAPKHKRPWTTSRISLCAHLLELPSGLAACICSCRTSLFLEVQRVPGCHWLIVESDNSLGRQPTFTGQEVGAIQPAGWESMPLSGCAWRLRWGWWKSPEKWSFSPQQPGKVVLKPMKAQPVARYEERMWRESPDEFFCFWVVAHLSRPFQLQMTGTQLKPA